MAYDKADKGDRRPNKKGRKKVCAFCVDKVETIDYKDAAKLENFSILEEYRKKGYGSCLFNHVLNELKTLGIKDIYLTADYEDTPKVMYERMGFTMVGRSYQVREVFK